MTFCFTGENPKENDILAIHQAGGVISKTLNDTVNVMVVKNATKLGTASAVKALQKGVPFLIFSHFMSLVRGDSNSFDDEYGEEFDHGYGDEKDGDLE